jgi:hypothetical protein
VERLENVVLGGVRRVLGERVFSRPAHTPLSLIFGLQGRPGYHDDVTGVDALEVLDREFEERRITLSEPHARMRAKAYLGHELDRQPVGEPALPSGRAP